MGSHTAYQVIFGILTISALAVAIIALVYTGQNHSDIMKYHPKTTLASESADQMRARNMMHSRNMQHQKMMEHKKMMEHQRMQQMQQEQHMRMQQAHEQQMRMKKQEEMKGQSAMHQGKQMMPSMHQQEMRAEHMPSHMASGGVPVDAPHLYE